MTLLPSIFSLQKIHIYTHAHPTHVHMYICMYARCVCVHVCVLQMCAYAELCATCVCGVCYMGVRCVCVCAKEERQLLQAFKCVYLYTAVYVHAHTHKMPLRLQENSIVQGYYFINDHMFASSAPDTI